MPLLAPLAIAADVVGMALAALVLLAGAFVVVLCITEVVRHIPVIGPWFASPVSALADDVFGHIRQWCEDAIHPIVGIFSHPAVVADAHAKAGVAAHVHHQQVNQYIAGVWVPTLISDTRAAATNQVRGALAYVDTQVVPAVQASLHSLQGELDQDAEALRSIESQLANLSDTVFGGHLAEAVAGLQSVVGTVQSQLAQAYRDLAESNGQIESTATLAANAYGYTDTQLRRATETVEDQAAAGDTAVRGDVVSGLRTGNPALPVELAGALQAVAAEAVTAASFVRDCGEPMCDWWHSNTGGLGQLLNLFGVAELAALITAAIADPGGVARLGVAVSDEFTGLGNDVLALFGLG